MKTGLGRSFPARVLPMISDIGVYGQCIKKLNTFNAAHRITNSNRTVKFWIPPEDETAGTVIKVSDTEKNSFLFRFKNNGMLSDNPNLYVSFVTANSVSIIEENLYALV